MTPEILQADVCREIEKITAGVALEDREQKPCRLNVYEQNLPLEMHELEDRPFPYCIVGLTGNTVTGIREPQRQEMMLYFGICYWGSDCRWQHAMLTLFERIKKRFLTDPLLGPFSCRPEMDCVLDDEDDTTYPHYFGAMRLVFDLPNYEREDGYC